MAKLFSAVFAFSPKKSVLVLEILFLSAEKNEKAEKNSGSRGDRLRAFIRRIFLRNFPVFNALAAVLCFIVVPGLIIHKGMDAVLDRMEDIALERPPEWSSSNLFWGIKHMPIRFRARQA